MRMFNNCRFGFLTVAFVAALTMSMFGAVASADETNKEAEEFFSKMSPEQFSDPVALDDFIRRFPDSDQARIAFAFRYSLLEKMPTIEGYNEFISKYPDKLQAQVAIQEVFKLYRYQNRVTGYYDFIKRYPNTQQAVVAMMRIQELMFEYVCKLDKEEEYDAFISAFPDAPQVEEAKKKALTKATEKEQLIYNEFLKNNPNAGFNDKKGFASKWISPWEMRMEEYYNIKQENPEKIQETAFQLEWIQLDRRGKVLQKVYSEVNEGRVAKCRRDYFLADTLLEIKKTLETNHKELLVKLDKETNKICDKLEQLHLDNQQTVQELRKGFAVLHQDMVDIKTQLSKINETLNNMDRHLEAINRSIVEGFKQTNENITEINNNITKLNNTVKTGFEIQAQLTRQMNQNIINGFKTTNDKLGKINENVKTGFATTNQRLDILNENEQKRFEAKAKLAQQTLFELRTQTQQLTDQKQQIEYLTNIAQGGFESVGNMWKSKIAQDQYKQMENRFEAVSTNKFERGTFFGQFLGGLAATATATVTEAYAPCATPCLTTLAYKVGEFGGDIGTDVFKNSVIPCAQDLFNGFINGDSPEVLSDKFQVAAKKIWNDSYQKVCEVAPAIWEEEKINICYAATSLAQKAGLNKENLEPIFDAANEMNLQKAVEGVSSIIGVSADALRFYADYII